MCGTWVISRKTVAYQSHSNLRLLFEQLAPLNVIELKVFRNSMCGFYYDVKVNYKFVLSMEMHEYKPPTAH